MLELRLRDIKRMRKAQQCIWCSEQILLGMPATYRVAIDKGFQADYFHPECFTAMDNYGTLYVTFFWDPYVHPRGGVNADHVFDTE